MAKTPPGKSSGKPPVPVENNGLRAELERVIGEVVGQGSRQIVVERVYTLMSSERFSGPLPHPRHLQGYEDIEPGTANRIITMAEASQNHLHKMDEKIIDAEVTGRKQRLFAGIALVCLLAIGSFILAFIGNNIGSGILLGGAVLSVVGTLFSQKPPIED